MKNFGKDLIKKSALFALGMALSLGFVFGLSSITYASTANPFPFDFEQANGEEITLNFRGDEFFSWWESQEGFVVAFDTETNNWRYAGIIDDEIVPTGGIVGAVSANDSETMAARIDREAILPFIVNGWRFDPGNPMVEFLGGEVLVDHRQFAGPSPRPSLLTSSGLVNSALNVPSLQHGHGVNRPTVPAIPIIPNLPAIGGGTQQPPRVQPPSVNPEEGDDIIISQAPAAPGGFGASFGSIEVPANQRLLLVLLEFDNMPLTQDAAFHNNRYFNSAPGNISVVNYFRDMSGGSNVFVPAGQITGGGTFPVSLADGNFPWATSGIDATITPSGHNGVVTVRLHMDHPITAWTSPDGHMASRDALSLALSAIYDNTDFDFAGVSVAAVFAGGEASDNHNPGGQIWAHAWQFRGSTVGQTGWLRYMAYGERQRNDYVMGIGIAAHELGHVLGLPDLYDITGRSEGIGPYSLMGHGSWGRGPQDDAVGQRPTALDPWSLMQLGFVQPIVVSEGTWRGNVNSLNTGNQNIILISSPAGPTQYFLIENRQFSNTWDMGLRGWIPSADNQGGIFVHLIDDAMYSDNPAEPNRNNNNPHHLMVGVIEADGGSLLTNSVANWQNFAGNHAFFGGVTERFANDSDPSSHFHSGSGQAGGRNVDTGIELIVHGRNGDAIEIEINLAQSGGNSTPRLIR